MSACASFFLCQMQLLLAKLVVLHSDLLSQNVTLFIYFIAFIYCVGVLLWDGGSQNTRRGRRTA